MKYSKEELSIKIQQVKHWYHTVEVAPGVFTPGIRNCQELLELLELPDDCGGLRVLDLGASDGFFAITLNRRGAKETVAIDYRPAEKTGFPILQDIFDSKVRFITDNVYNITPEDYGEFDIVLCLGVVYHLRNPLLLLDRIREVCKGWLYLESFVIDNRLITKDGGERPLADISQELLGIPIMQFYPRNELDGDYTNWWGPNSTCLKEMLESANFTIIFQKVLGSRAVFKCKVNDDSDTKYWRQLERSAMLY